MKEISLSKSIISKIILYFKKVIRLLLLNIALLSSLSVFAQEIDFGTYSSQYSLTLTDLAPGSDLDFGTVYQNEGSVPVALINSKVLSIEGVKYLDVIIDITADDYLLLDGNPACASDPNCRIPFTLQAAYANRGSNNTSHAVLITTVGNTASSQFPVKYRGSSPPGPPPTPVYSGYNSALYNETAYLYIYGALTIGNINVGTYTSNITISVNYDQAAPSIILANFYFPPSVNTAGSVYQPTNYHRA